MNTTTYINTTSIVNVTVYVESQQQPQPTVTPTADTVSFKSAYDYEKLRLPEGMKQCILKEQNRELEKPQAKVAVVTSNEAADVMRYK